MQNGIELFSQLAHFGTLVIAITLGLVLFFTSKQKKAPAILLSVFFLLLGYVQFQLFLSYTDYNDLALRLIILFMPVFWAIIPTKYLYIQSLSDLDRFPLIRLLHYLPSFLLMIVLLLFALFWYHEGVDMFINVLYFVFLGGVVLQILVYFILIVRMIRRHQKKIGDFLSSTENVNLKWMRIALTGFAVFILLSLVAEFFDFKADSLALPVIYTVYMLYLAIQAFKQNSLREELDRICPEEKNSKGRNVVAADVEEHGRYAKSSLKDQERVKKIVTDLRYLMDVRKAYLKPDLNLIHVSRELGVNYKYVSQVINSEFEMSFINLVARYRIREAQRMIKLDEFKDDTLQGIGEMAGFKSKSTFYSSFKKFTGKTPKQYRETI